MSKKGNIKKENSGDYYIINGTRIEKGHPDLVFNHTTQTYVRKSMTAGLKHGIIGIHKNGRLKHGYFNLDSHSNITMILHNGTKKTGMDYSVVQNNYNYRENLSNGYFYYYKAIKADAFSELKEIERAEKTRLPYSLTDEIMPGYLAAYRKHKAPSLETPLLNISKSISPYTFGLEFETVNGFIPPRLTSKFGLVPLRDGSIQGIEYATIPLKGEKGIYSLVKGLELLKERTSFNNSCSIHLHLGNVPRTKPFILALYIFSVLIQKDMFAHFPITKEHNWRIKNKNYNRPYDNFDVLLKLDKVINKDNIKANFDILLSKLAMGLSCNGLTLSQIKEHPSDPTNQHKWQVRPRYHWLNLIPLIFINKKTVEFRIHTPTFNKDKILSYMLLCTSILRYVERNTEKILSNYTNMGTMYLQDILQNSSLAPKLSGGQINSLSSYWQHRQNVTQEQNRNGEIKGDENGISAVNISNLGKMGNGYNEKEPIVAENRKLRGTMRSPSIGKKFSYSRSPHKKSPPGRDPFSVGTTSWDTSDDSIVDIKNSFSKVNSYSYDTGTDPTTIEVKPPTSWYSNPVQVKESKKAPISKAKSMKKASNKIRDYIRDEERRHNALIRGDISYRDSEGILRMVENNTII